MNYFMSSLHYFFCRFKILAQLCSGGSAYDLHIGQAAFVFSTLAFVFGFISSLLEVFKFDPSDYLDFIQGFIATDKAFFIVFPVLVFTFLIKLFGFTSQAFVQRIIKAYLDVGTEVGVLSALTTFFLGVGALLSFSIFGDSKQVEVSLELMEYGVWFILIWLTLSYARKLYLGCRDKIIYIFPFVNLLVAVLICIFTELFYFQRYFLVFFDFFFAIYFIYELR